MLSENYNFNCQQAIVLMAAKKKLTDMLDMYIINLHLAMPQKCCCPFLPSNTVPHCHFPKKESSIRQLGTRRHSKTTWLAETLESRDNGVILQKLLQDSATW